MTDAVFVVDAAAERGRGERLHDLSDVHARLPDELAWLQQHILELAEEEHRQLGQELHDGLAQELTGIALRGKALEGSLRERGLDEAREAGELVRLINESIDGVRAIVRGLHPQSIGDLGFAAALARMCGDFEAAYHVSCRVVANDVPQLTVGVASHLYRIVQEAVGNAIRHGCPRQVMVVVAVRRSKFRMLIVDDGTGFDVAATPRRGGLGLGGMRFRALAIGARIGVRSHPGRGCRVHVFLPLRAPSGPDFGLASRRWSEPEG
jgi:signal transduction histidine kinase